jgi:hypothetical protein
VDVSDVVRETMIFQKNGRERERERERERKRRIGRRFQRVRDGRISVD